MKPAKLDLTFVKDNEVRAVLEDYYSQGEKAFSSGSYLGALVACGSVVEGLLTWALLLQEEQALKSKDAYRDKQGQVRPLREWNLSNLIDVANELNLVGKTAKQAAWALKDFRNFIHPYNVLQQSARPDQSLAMSAMAAVSEITRSLKGKVPQRKPVQRNTPWR